MGIKDNFYTSSTSSTNFYGTTSSFSQSEINLRQEFLNTLDGLDPEIAKAQIGLLRKMNRDSDGNLIPCECVDSITKEPDKDRFCGICFGEGYKWTENYIDFYKTLVNSSSGQPNTLDKLHETGLINIPLVVFYTKYNSEITVDDKIVTLSLSEDGSVSQPVKRTNVYRINTLWDYRADNGKLEYFKIYTHKEFVKYLNAPSYSEV